MTTDQSTLRFQYLKFVVEVFTRVRLGQYRYLLGQKRTVNEEGEGKKLKIYNFKGYTS